MDILKNKSNYIITKNNDILTCYSYTSKICEYNTKNQKIKIYNDFNYSRTTSKHFNNFINEFTTIDLNELKKDIKYQKIKIYNS